MSISYTKLPIALALCLVGCATSIPDRFTTDPSISPDCGYSVQPIGSTGLSLEVFFRAYSFFPTPDAAIQGGRECFTRTAAALAKRRGKKLVPVNVGDMNSNANRDITNGYYAVYVTGKLMFLQE